jgi:hypothetical protein
VRLNIRQKKGYFLSESIGSLFFTAYEPAGKKPRPKGVATPVKRSPRIPARSPFAFPGKTKPTPNRRRLVGFFAQQEQRTFSGEPSSAICSKQDLSLSFGITGSLANSLGDEHAEGFSMRKSMRKEVGT